MVEKQEVPRLSGDEGWSGEWVRRLYTFNTGNGARHDLVEDVVGALQGLLGDDTGLLQQICKGRELASVNCLYIAQDVNLQVSISAPASLPVGPKWIRMNLPWFARENTI